VAAKVKQGQKPPGARSLSQRPLGVSFSVGVARRRCGRCGPCDEMCFPGAKEPGCSSDQGRGCSAGRSTLWAVEGQCCLCNDPSIQYVKDQLRAEHPRCIHDDPVSVNDRREHAGSRAYYLAQMCRRLDTGIVSFMICHQMK
jgi:hypothetical protein